MSEPRDKLIPGTRRRAWVHPGCIAGDRDAGGPGLLFGIVPLDPATLVGVAVLVFVLALLAAYLPARRAMRVDPIEALRQG